MYDAINLTIMHEEMGFGVDFNRPQNHFLYKMEMVDECLAKVKGHECRWSQKNPLSGLQHLNGQIFFLTDHFWDMALRSVS